MYKLFLLLASSLALAGCSDPPAFMVDCSRAPAANDGSTIVCNGGDGSGNGNDNDVGSPSGEPAPSSAPVILQAGCYQDLDVCPAAFPMSWMVEHCTIPYVCPVRDYDAGPEQRVCLRFMEPECWDKYSN